MGTDVQPRLSGQDLDSDSLYVTNQTDIVGLARRAYLEYPTIINAINPRAKSYTKSMEDFALMDASIAAGQQDVGESSNIAQLALQSDLDIEQKEEATPEKTQENLISKFYKPYKSSAASAWYTA